MNSQRLTPAEQPSPSVQPVTVDRSAGLFPDPVAPFAHLVNAVEFVNEPQALQGFDQAHHFGHAGGGDHSIDRAGLVSDAENHRVSRAVGRLCRNSPDDFCVVIRYLLACYKLRFHSDCPLSYPAKYAAKVPA